jgi:hypothetical protein
VLTVLFAVGAVWGDAWGGESSGPVPILIVGSLILGIEVALRRAGQRP